MFRGSFSWLCLIKIMVWTWRCFNIVDENRGLNEGKPIDSLSFQLFPWVIPEFIHSGGGTPSCF